MKEKDPKKIIFKKSKFPFVRKVANGKKAPNIKRKYIGFAIPPHEPEEQNKLIIEMVEWADSDDTALDPDKFPIMKKISPYKFYKIAEKNEFFADGLSFAKYIIGLRLKEHVRDRKIDKDYLFRFLPLYHPEFKSWLIESRSKQNIEDKPTEITINMTPVPSISSKEENEKD